MARTDGLAVALRWFAGLWLVVWAIYATLIADYSSSTRETMVGVAWLLIGVSCLLNRLAELGENPNQSPERHQGAHSHAARVRPGRGLSGCTGSTVMAGRSHARPTNSL
jgi:hypothetical protein